MMHFISPQFLDIKMYVISFLVRDSVEHFRIAVLRLHSHGALKVIQQRTSLCYLCAALGIVNLTYYFDKLSCNYVEYILILECNHAYIDRRYILPEGAHQ